MRDKQKRGRIERKVDYLHVFQGTKLLLSKNSWKGQAGGVEGSFFLDALVSKKGGQNEYRVEIADEVFLEFKSHFLFLSEVKWSRDRNKKQYTPML